MWKPEELAYLAGLIDGEGCFAIHYHKKYRRLGGQLQIGNTNLLLLQWVEKHFGGTVTEERRHNARHKPIFRWVAHSKTLGDLITGVLPYLIAKREQADLMLAYRALRTPIVTVAHGTAKRSPETIQRQMEIRERLQVLNRRGVA